MKKKSLSVKKTTHKLFSNYLKNKKINKIFKIFSNYLNQYIDKNSKIGVAISGGPDSLSLAFLIKCYFLKNKVNIKFFIIDHKLRKNSLKEALLTRSLLKKLDIKSKIFQWKGKKPKANIQSVARINRYSLLKNACIKNNIRYLLIGHHIDDLRENFFIRLLRGSGLKGLSSFGEITKNESDNISILRPLIKFEKKDLVYVSSLVFKFFIEDPSNSSINFQRVRIRNILFELKKEGLDKKKLDLTIKNLKSANNAINYYSEENIKNNSKFLKQKNTFILNNFFLEHPDEVVLRSISIILRKISQRYYSPRGKSILDSIVKIRSSKIKKLTLGGCCLEKVNETILITKENET